MNKKIQTVALWFTLGVLTLSGVFFFLLGNCIKTGSEFK